MEEEGSPSDEDQEPEGGATQKLRAFRHLLLEMTMSRAVDNYLSYISGLLAAIFTSRPETLRTGEKVRVDAVLEHASMEELVAWLAERRVERLAYQGMSTLAEDLSERLGLSLFGESEDAGRAIRIVEIRNLIVHNRAVVNRVFLSRVPDYPAKEGDRIEIDVDDLFEDVQFLAGLCFDLDRRAAEKLAFRAL